MTIVCDPVHMQEPTTAVPTIIATSTPTTTTPMLFDPVHEPDSCGGDLGGVVSGFTTGIVLVNLDECRTKCGR